MKKVISIMISLALLISACFCMPLSASADAPGFDLNGWAVAPGTSGVATPNASAQTVSFTGMNYRAAYTKISNLEVGKTYELSFDVTPTAHFQLWVVPGSETISWDQGLPTNSSRAHVKTCNGTSFSTLFTATGDSFWFVFRNQTDTAATNEFTFSNFSFGEPSAEVVAGMAIADGTWKSTNGSVTNDTSAHTVTATSLSHNSIYTTISGLTPNTVYQLTFDMSVATGFKQLWMVPGSETLNLGGNTYPQNSSTFTATLSTSGTKFVAEFTANESSYHLVFRDYDATVTNITLSNFKLTVVRTISEEELAGYAIADGTWKATNGSVTNNTTAHTVTATSLSYNSIYTTISGLTPNTVYELSFDMNQATGFKQLWMAPGSETLSLNANNYPSNSSTFTATVTQNASNKFSAQFTANEASYHIVFRDYDATVTNITLSNFALTVVRTLSDAEIAGKAVANSDWNITTNASGTATKSNGTVKFTGARYQTMYTKLTDLTPNTVYSLTFDISATMEAQVWTLSGDTALTFNDTVPNGAALISSVNGTKATVEFTAEATSEYVFFRNTTGTDELTYSNFAIEAVRTLTEAELAGKDVANNGAWDVTKGASGTVTKSNGTVKLTGAQYQDVSLPLADLEPNTTYTLSFINSSTGIELFANTTYVIPGATAFAESLKSQEGTIRYACEAVNEVNEAGAIVTTVRFTTDDTNSNYLIVFHNDNVSEVTLSNFEFSNETAYEFKGTAIRAASGDVEQGMRFKNYIAADTIENGVNGKAVAEYGSIVAVKDGLDGELVIGGEGVKQGVAYNAEEGINKTFATDANGNKTYTVVVKGVPKAYYNEVFAVRSYVKLADNTVIYGDVQEYSIFTVFSLILAGNSDDDKAVVNAILEDEEVAAAYDEWKANK